MSGCFLLASGPDESITDKSERVAISLDAHLRAIQSIRVLVGKDEKSESIVAERNRGFGKVEAELHVRPPARRDEDLAGGGQVDDFPCRDGGCGIGDWG